MIDLLAEQEERERPLAAPSSFPSRPISRLGGALHIAHAGGSTAHITFSASAYESQPRIGLLRHYSPETGRWLSRDPIGERGGINLFAFIANAPISNYDLFGLWTVDGVLKNFVLQDFRDWLNKQKEYNPPADTVFVDLVFEEKKKEGGWDCSKITGKSGGSSP